MLLIPIEVLGDRFEKEYPSEEFDKVAWKNFFNRNAKFKTLCLSCIQQDQEIEKQKAMRLQRGAVDYDSDSDDGPRFGPVYLNAAATAIILKWKHTASDEVRRRGGRTASAALISDDDSDDDESVSWAKKRLKLNAVAKPLRFDGCVWPAPISRQAVYVHQGLGKHLQLDDLGLSTSARPMEKKKDSGTRRLTRYRQLSRAGKKRRRRRRSEETG